MKYAYIVGLFFITALLFNSHIVSADTTTTYTPYSVTECENEICTLQQFSGIRFIYENNTWKPLENAISLKDVWGVYYLEYDGDHIINVIDYNYDYISMDLEFIGEAEEYEYEVEAGKIKIKLKMIETICDVDFNCIDSEIEYEVEIEDGENTHFAYFGNPYGKKFKFGEHSTTIQLRAPDTENMADGFVHSGSPTKHWGGETWEQLDVTPLMRLLHMYNITDVPAGQVIINSTFALKALYDDSGGDRMMDIHHVTNHTFVDDITHIPAVLPNFTWNNQPCGTGFLDSAQCNLTVQDRRQSAGVGWYYWNVTQPVARDYIEGWKNVSFALKYESEYGDDDAVQFYTKEVGTLAHRPYLNITYEPPTTTTTTTTTLPPIVDFDYCRLMWAYQFAQLVSNHDWCLDNTTIATNKTFIINVDGNESTITSYSEEDCLFGCDNVTEECAPDPVSKNIWFGGGVLVVLLVIGLIGYLWRRL